MMNKITYQMIQRISLLLGVIFISATVIAQSVHNSVELGYYNQNSNNYLLEENCIDFYIIGMINEQDAVIAEDLLNKHKGIARARTNYYTKTCQIITWKGSKLDQQAVSALLADVGFTIRNFSVRVIRGPSKANSDNHIEHHQYETHVRQAPNTVTRREITPEQRLKQIKLLRKNALKNGTPIYKYDKLIMELNKQIKSKGQHTK